jgi:IS5 family transposase
MRLKFQEQLPVVFHEVAHRRADELSAIDEKLASLGEELVLGVHADLVRGLEAPDSGRRGLSADTTLRALIIKQLFQLSYDGLEFHLRDSVTARSFCRIESLGPSRSALHRAIKAVRPQTLEVIHELLIGSAIDDEIEDGQTVSLDATAVNAKIRAPTDSGLLCDVVRVGTRLLKKVARHIEISFCNHNRLARRRHLAAHHARRKTHRVPHYRRLLWAAGRVLRWVGNAIEQLPRNEDTEKLHDELRKLALVGPQVIHQARRRVIRGESVPSTEKVVSLHEPHVDIIRKDNRNTYFGHKLFAARGVSGLILDLSVVRGNPSDAASAVELVQRLESVLGKLPSEVAMDGGFASKANLEELKELGLTNVCFAKSRGMEIDDMVSDARTFRRLRNFRSMIEASFSWLKRSFGLDCCDWRGFESFRAYAWAAALTHNLVIMARAGPV